LEGSDEDEIENAHHIALIVFLYAALLSSHSALAQFLPQGPKLVGSGAVEPGRQGSSVAFSADGNTAIVGGENDNGGIGATWDGREGRSDWRDGLGQSETEAMTIAPSQVS
jgi:hypothetical protein